MFPKNTVFYHTWVKKNNKQVLEAGGAGGGAPRQFGDGTSSSSLPEPLALNYNTNTRGGKKLHLKNAKPSCSKSSTAVTMVTAGNTHLLLGTGWKTFTDIVRVGT